MHSFTENDVQPASATPVALKGYWTVTAGVIPGETMEHMTRQFMYNSDHQTQDTRSESPTTHFQQLMGDAHEYARQITDPNLFNWIRVEFVWL